LICSAISSPPSEATSLKDILASCSPGAAFEEGVKIHRQCHTALTNAEQRISVLSENDNYSEEKSFGDS
jgi:hypothetical protein